jgi:hypothetical protein
VAERGGEQDRALFRALDLGIRRGGGDPHDARMDDPAGVDLRPNPWQFMTAQELIAEIGRMEKTADGWSRLRSGVKKVLTQILPLHHSTK